VRTPAQHPFAYAWDETRCETRLVGLNATTQARIFCSGTPSCAASALISLMGIVLIGYLPATTGQVIYSGVVRIHCGELIREGKPITDSLTLYYHKIYRRTRAFLK
jgi:hypothetical protein